jgi:hypothetical protein
MNGKWLRILISVLLTSVLINPGIVTQTGAASQDAPRSAVVAAAALSPAESHAVAAPQVASLTVNKTVGTNPSVCAATDSINVGPGTPVTYCYTVQNTGDQNLVTHDLVDDRLGAILNDFSYNLIPGASAFLTSTVTITESVINTATWTAQASGGGSASDSDTATVTVVQPSLTITKTVGTDPAVCANTDSVAVEPGTPVTYCYIVENTGIQSLVTHDLVDDRLGALLNDFPYVLMPGATAFLTSTVTITESVVNTATWTAQTSGAYSASDNDTATVTVLQPSLAITKTVGTDAAVCAAADTISVEPGTPVTYCYTVENTGSQNLVAHDLVDDRLGPLLNNFPYMLVPGATAFITSTAVITSPVVNTATWTAQTSGGDSASDSDTATVNLPSPPSLLVYLPLVLKQ